jgi:hypothetical protein
MNRHLPLTVVLALAACAGHEGVYEPACIAFEGDRIELRGGRFAWDRFTDQRSVDADGNVIDAFPDFPKTGKYTLDAERLGFVTDDGVRVADWFLIEQQGQRYLLSEEQHERYLDLAELPRCGLLLASAK